MLSHNQAKFVTSLGQKKQRLQQGKFLVEGDKMVVELLGQQRIGISAIFGLERWAERNANVLKGFLDKFNTVSEAELSKLSMLTTPNQVLAVANIPDKPCDVTLPAKDICFFLDGIQDPGNMGSILRIADWFGFPAVYCGPDCVDIYSPKVVQASMGAIFRVPSWEIELASILLDHPETPVTGAVLDAANLFSAKLPSSGLLVIGNEGRGISADNARMLTHRVSIPRHPLGGAESLNASVAAGILAAEFRR